jgi:hypothetical protein
MTRRRDAVTRQRAMLAALLLLVFAAAACGKYGKPVRSHPTPPTAVAVPGATAPASPPATPAGNPPASGQDCEDDQEKPAP